MSFKIGDIVRVIDNPGYGLICKIVDITAPYAGGNLFATLEHNGQVCDFIVALDFLTFDLADKEIQVWNVFGGHDHIDGKDVQRLLTHWKPEINCFIRDNNNPRWGYMKRSDQVIVMLLLAGF